jgi:DNA-binding NarL/FixJ family response regulator
MISVLLADDQALVRAGFRLIVELEPDIRVVAEAEDGRQAVELARERRPDVVLMDIRMPTLDGIEATRRLFRAGVETRVLVLTTFDLDEYVYDAMKAGASGFLLKDVPREQLVAGIRIVAGGESLLAPAITRRLIEQFVRRPPPGTAAPLGLEELSGRELDVLRHLARGMSNAEIAKALVVGDSTVKTHVAHILQKLDLRDRVQAVVFAYETGLVQPGERSSNESPISPSRSATGIDPH